MAGERMWRTADLGGLELFRATISAFAFHPHAHEEFFIALTETGVATPMYRGSRHILGPGDLLVLNPEESHAGGPPSGRTWTYRAIYPSPSLMREIAAELPRSKKPEFHGDSIRDPRVAERLRRFHELSEQSGSSALEREAHLTEALVLLIARHAAPQQDLRSLGGERQSVERTKAYLEEHAHENVSLRELARQAGLSPFHLCRVFRGSTGMTPHAYQTQVRIRRARNLLRAGMPITLAATESGFYDQAHLTRHFKRVMGLTPGRYARN